MAGHDPQPVVLDNTTIEDVKARLQIFGHGI